MMTTKRYPLLQSQFGVFIECIQYPDCTQYNLPTITPLDDKVDLDHMEQAFHIIYNSRVAWRLRFGIGEDGVPYQYEDREMEFKVVRSKMTDADFQEYAYNGFCRPFDLMGEEPLVRIELVQTEINKYLLIDVHHLIMDGLSYAQIFSHQEFNTAYVEGNLPDETYTILDAAEDEQNTLEGETYEKAKAYYAEKYADIDFTTLSSRPDNPLGQMLRVHEYVDKNKVDTWCTQQEVAVNLLFQAAFSYVMSVLLREDRIAYTTVSHGRFGKRWRTICGMFSREMPVLSEIKDGQTVIDYISSFRSELMSTKRYAAYPISHLCRDLKKSLGACFNFFAVKEYSEYLLINNEQYPGAQQERTNVSIDMNVEIYQTGNNYDIRVDSSDSMNSLETLDIFAHSMCITLQKMMQNPESLIKSL